MSRVGRRVLEVPSNVEVNIDEKNFVTIKGPLGTNSRKFPMDFSIVYEENKITIKPLIESKNKQLRMMYGTINSLINGMIEGVHKGFKKELEIKGVGYNVKMNGKILLFSLGYSHKIEKEIPDTLKVEVIKNTELVISGINKQEVGQFASQIKKLRKPEPYGGKGIKYKGEHIIRKAGKSSK